MRNKQNKMKLITILSMFIIIYIYIVNMSGIVFKISENGQFYAYAFPDGLPDLVGASHSITIKIKKIKYSSKTFEIYASRRKGFRTFYWETGSNNLWVDGEAGIQFFFYTEEKEEWEEWYIDWERSGEEWFFIDNANKSQEKCIDKSILPKSLLERME